MNERRLSKLSDLLEADAKNPKGIKFDLHFWGGVANGAPNKAPPSTLPLNCNTVGCAVGLACISGAFKREGLGWRPDDNENNIIPMYRGCGGFSAVRDFFDLAYDESDFLFAHDRYPKSQRRGKRGELAVAKRIRDFVAGKASPDGGSNAG